MCTHPCVHCVRGAYGLSKFQSYLTQPLPLRAAAVLHPSPAAAQGQHDEGVVAAFAMRRIRKGEELTIFYSQDSDILQELLEPKKVP